MPGRLTFFLRYALRSLRRDSTRTLLAILCVAFGVLSLVSMQLLAHTLLSGALFDQRLGYGGDASIESEQYGGVLTDADLQQIEQWRQEGLIAAYTPVSSGTGIYLRTENSGRVTLIMNALGVDFASYPLIGEIVMREPAGVSPADLLREPTDALLTRDIADPLGLRIGDTFILSGGNTSPTRLTLAGIIGATPSQEGKAVYYSLETARLLENRADVVTKVPILFGDVPNAQQQLVDSPYRVWVASTERADSSGTRLFDLMLKGAGVLGLLVGGIGVSNTLQVILARRKLEIAMLKTLGYQRGALLTLIGLETGIIGITGGVIGGTLGVALTERLLDLISRSGTLMLAWTPDTLIVGGGIAAGAVTAVVFGLQAILASSATRPVELLRDLPVKTSQRVAVVRLVLYGAMMLVFGLLVGVILGSPLEGVALVIGGALALVVLRFVFWVVLWVILKLPAPPVPILRFARSSLNQRKAQSSLAVLALFAGAFSVTFAAMAIYNAQETVMSQRDTDEGYNLLVFTDADSANNVVGRATNQGANSTYVSYRVLAMVGGESVTVVGRSRCYFHVDLAVTSGAWTADDRSAVIHTSFADRYPIGDAITVNAGEGEATLTITGYYDVVPEPLPSIAGHPVGLIVSPDTALALGGERTQTQVIASFPVERLNAATDALGAQLTDALVFSKADLNDFMITTYRSLFTFAASVAGLAFVAGAILIANSTGLAVVERRREIGVFKAVGYTSGRVLRLFLSEYAFLGVLSGILGVVGVVIVIAVINISLAPMQFEPVIATAMVLLSIAIALISAAIVAWQPTRVRPLDVLRYE